MENMEYLRRRKETEAVSGVELKQIRSKGVGV